MRSRLSHAAVLMSSTVVATGAIAQLAPPPPVRQLLDANRVDLFAGQIHVAGPSLSLGANGQGLSYQQLNYGSGWTDSVAGFIYIYGSSVYVTYSGVTDRFTLSGGTYTSTEGNGSTLTLANSVYTYVTSGGTVVHLDASKAQSTIFYSNGGLVSDVNLPSGDKLSYTYTSQAYCSATKPLGSGQTCIQRSTAYRLNSVTDSFGYQLTYAYNNNVTISPNDTNGGSEIAQWATATGISGANLASSTTALATQSFGSTGSNATYAYNITDTMGRVTKYPFASGLAGIGGITWPSSSSQNVTVAYSNSKVSSVSYAGGPATSYSFSDSGNTRTATVTDGAGDVITYLFDIPSQRLTSKTDGNRHVTSYQVDSFGRVVQVTNPENDYTQYTYDSNGNVSQQTRVSKTAGTPGNIVISANYPCSTAATCNEPSWTKDANLNETDYTYDPTTGKVLTVTLPAPASGGVRPQTRYSYTSMQAYFQNSSGSIAASGQPIAMLTGVSACRTNTSCVGTSDETRVTIAYGAQAAGTGNNLLPISTSSGAGDGSLTVTSSMTYDAVGNALTITDPLGYVSRTRYDADREVVGTVGTSDGSGSNWNPAMRYTYNADGLVTLAEQGTVPSEADSDWGSFTVHHKVASSYDSADRKIQDVAQDSGGNGISLVQYSYDAAGRPDCTAQRMNVSVYGSLPDACSLGTQGSFGPDRIGRNEYDAANHVTKVWEGYRSSIARATQFSYTANGQQQSLVDANNNVTTYVYDGFDRVAQTQYPSPTSPGSSNPSDYEQFGYDANGNITSHRLRDGKTTPYSYDLLNRLTTIYTQGEPGDANPSYTYDLLGHVISIGNGNGVYSTGTNYSYDALGRMITETSYYNSQGATTKSMQYDLDGRRTRLSWQDGIFVTYQYWNNGSMRAVFDHTGSLLANWGYDDDGRRTAVCRNNNGNMCTSYSYDAASRLNGMTLTPSAAGTNIGLGNYSPAGDIGQRTNSNDAFAWTQGYNVNRSYTPNGLNQYSSVAGTAQGYDARGNLISSGGSSYSYDSFNDLTGWNGGNFWYDAAQRLTYSTSTSTRFDYDGNQLVTELDANNNILRRYVYGPNPDEPIAWYEGSGTATKRFPVADERGSIVWVQDASGNTVAQNSYDEYGIPASTNQGRFQYTGQAWMPEIGMSYYKARMYSPSLGRFMQIDPSGYNDGPNWYNYVHSNPINGIDPSGLDDAIPSVIENGGGGGDAGIAPPIIVNGDRPQAASLGAGDLSYAPPGFTGGGAGNQVPAPAIVVNANKKKRLTSANNDSTCAQVAQQLGAVLVGGGSGSFVPGLGLTAGYGGFRNIRTGSTGYFGSIGGALGFDGGFGPQPGLYRTVADLEGLNKNINVSAIISGSLNFSSKNKPVGLSLGGKAELGLSFSVSETFIFGCTLKGS